VDLRLLRTHTFNNKKLIFIKYVHINNIYLYDSIMKISFYYVINENIFFTPHYDVKIKKLENLPNLYKKHVPDYFEGNLYFHATIISDTNGNPCFAYNEKAHKNILKCIFQQHNFDPITHSKYLLQLYDGSICFELIGNNLHQKYCTNRILQFFYPSKLSHKSVRDIIIPIRMYE